jgi:IS1 family transposase
MKSCFFNSIRLLFNTFSLNCAPIPAARLSKEKRVLVLSAITEGMPIASIGRMFKVGPNTVQRVIAETGEALANYTGKRFRNLACRRLELDEQWQFVGMHGQRMNGWERERGDFWLWAVVDADSKLVVSYRIDRRNSGTAELFIEDLSKRVNPNVEVTVTTDAHPHYRKPLNAYFSRVSTNYATEAKVFVEGFRPDKCPNSARTGWRRSPRLRALQSMAHQT